MIGTKYPPTAVALDQKEVVMPDCVAAYKCRKER